MKTGLVALGWLWALAVQAAPTVLLLRVDDDEAAVRWRVAERRTGDELRAMGLAVIELQAADPEEDAGAVERWMAERGATAAIRVERNHEVGDARVWLLDERGQLRTAQLEGLALGGGEAASLAALRAVELVRAGLLEVAEAEPEVVARDVREDAWLVPAAPVVVPTAVVGARPPPHAAPVVPAAAPLAPALAAVLATPSPASRAQRPAAPARELGGRHALAVAATVGGGPGAPGALTGLELGYRRELPRVVALQVELLGATSPGWQAQGSGSIVLGLAGARVMLVVQPRQERVVTPRLGLGGGGALVWAVGRAQAPLRGVRDVGGAGLVSGFAGLAVRVRPRLRVLVGAGLDVSLPPIVVRVAGEEAARFGQPTLRGALGLEWVWSRPRGS